MTACRSWDTCLAAGLATRVGNQRPLDCALSARQKMRHQFQFLRAGIVRTGLSVLESCATPCAPSSRRTIERRSVSVTSTSPSTRRGGSLMACAIFVRCSSPPSQASIYWNIRRKVFLPDVKETVKNFCHHRSFGFVSCDADDGDIWFAAASVEGGWFKDISVTEADMLVDRFGEIVEGRCGSAGAHLEHMSKSATCSERSLGSLRGFAGRAMRGHCP